MTGSGSEFLGVLADPGIHKVTVALWSSETFGNSDSTFFQGSNHHPTYS